MTNITLHAPESRGVRFNGGIESLLTGAVLALMGFLSLAIFAG